MAIDSELSQQLDKIAGYITRIGAGDLGSDVPAEFMSGELKGIAVALQQAVDGLRVKNLQFEESSAQLVQSEKLSVIGEMSAGVTHELNQPLNVTKIICQSMLQDIQKNRFDMETAKEDIPEIITQMDRMATIIDHMRVFSRRTEGNVLEDVAVNTVVENVFIFLGQQLKTHNIEVVKEYGKELPEFKGDQIRLEQVFINLITNARHATEISGKDCKRIDIRTFLSDNKDAVVVEVKDNGVGIPVEIREKIFESFFTTKEKGKGTGLGLSVAKRIVGEHRGRLEVDSVVGEWTAFKVVLPVT